MADVTFTGGEGGASRDLSLAANWSAEPTSGDVATVDLATFGGTFTMGGDLVVAGLRLANATTSTDVSLSGTGRLSVGASGVVFPDGKAAKSLTISVPATLTAAQTWSLAATPTDFKSSVSGTADWTVDILTNAVRVYKLGYGGLVTYTGAKGQVRFLGTTNWAAKVHIIASGASVLSVTNTVYWSDIFTGAGHALEFSDDSACRYGDFYICQPSVADAGTTGSVGRIIFRDGDTLATTDAYKYRNKTVWIGQGILDQRGGTIVGCDRFQPTVSAASKTLLYNEIQSSLGGYAISGGSYSSSFLMLGGDFSPTPDTGNNVKIVQTGGSVNLNSALWLTSADWRNESRRRICEYVLGGGTLNVGYDVYGGYNKAQTYDLSLAGAHTRDSSYMSGLCAGILTITNGTLAARYVKIGTDITTTELKSGLYENGYAYGHFDMRGGSYPLSQAINGTTVKSKGFTLGQCWNNLNHTNGCYRINLSGGTMSVASGGWTNRFGFFFPTYATAQPFTWDTGAGETLFVAPISGSGTLRKAGAGTLTIRDASRFDGTLDVAAGSVRITGDIGADDLTDDCYKWTADSLKGTIADGGVVESWEDVNYASAAVSNNVAGGTGKDYRWSCPTLIAASDSFNGHAALAFKTAAGYASLCAPNMVAEAKACTFVAVFRRKQTDKDNATAAHGRAACGLCDGWVGTVLRLGARCETNGGPSVPFAYMSAYDKDDASRTEGHYWQNTYALVTNPIPDVVGASAPCHVMVATLDNGVYSVFSDGQYNARSNTYWTSSHKLETNRRFFIGGYITDTATVAESDVEVAEIRVYPTHALSYEEQRQLGSHLFAKYRGVADGECRADLWHGVYDGQVEKGSESVPARPEGGTSWNAAALNALSAPTGSDKPTLVTGTFGGEDAMHFDGTAALAIPAADSPLAGASAFTMAVVFRTTEDGATGLDTTQAAVDGTVGLVSSRKEMRNWDAQLTLARECALNTECANGRTFGKIRMLDRRPCRLNDGNVHVAILSEAPTTVSGMKTMVDGRYNELPSGGIGLGTDVWQAGETFAAYDVNIGVQCAEAQAGYFKGDIAEVVLYPRALGRDEMTALSENLAAKYRFRLLPKFDFKNADVTARGLSATQIIVRAGARLTMPFSQTGAYRLVAGATLTGAGELLGSYRIGDGARLDLAANTPEALTDVQMADGGRIRVDVTKPFEFEHFSTAAGTIALDLVNYDPKTSPSRLTLFTFKNAPSIDAGTAWKIDGQEDFEIVMKDGKLILRQRRGIIVIFR